MQVEFLVLKNYKIEWKRQREKSLPREGQHQQVKISIKQLLKVDFWIINKNNMGYSIL